MFVYQPNCTPPALKSKQILKSMKAISSRQQQTRTDDTQQAKQRKCAARANIHHSNWRSGVLTHMHIHICVHMQTNTYIYTQIYIVCMYICVNAHPWLFMRSVVLFRAAFLVSRSQASQHICLFSLQRQYDFFTTTSTFLHIYTLHFACASSPLASHIYFAYLLCHELLVYGVAHCWLHLFVVLPTLSLSLFSISFIVCSRILYYTLSLTYTSYLLASVTVAQSSVTIFQHIVVLVHA